MKGYFSSLIEQTGITFNKGRNADAPPPGLLPAGPKKMGGIDTLEAEEARGVKPVSDQMSEIRHRGGNEETESPTPRMHTIPVSTHERSENRLSAESQKELFHRENQNQQKFIPEKQRRNDNSPETAISPRETGGEKLQSNDDQINGKQVWQAALKEVKEWVAGAPVSITEEIHRAHTGTVENQMPQQMPVRGIYDQKPATVEHWEKPEGNDLQLSIGTISITVEDPGREVRKNGPPQTGRRSEPLKEDLSSRLGRYYIRI